MSTDLTTELQAPNGGAPPPPPPAQEDMSLLAELRAERNRVATAQTKVFVIPGYEHKTTPLACRYGIIPLPEQKRIETKAAEAADTDDMWEFHFWQDQLIAAAREFGVMRGDDFVALPGSVRWDGRLTRGLEIDVGEDRARAHMLAVFEAENGERAGYRLIDHHTEVITNWMRGGRSGDGAEQEADEAFRKN